MTTVNEIKKKYTGRFEIYQGSVIACILDNYKTKHFPTEEWKEKSPMDKDIAIGGFKVTKTFTFPGILIKSPFERDWAYMENSYDLMDYLDLPYHIEGIGWFNREPFE